MQRRKSEDKRIRRRDQRVSIGVKGVSMERKDERRKDERRWKNRCKNRERKRSVGEDEND
jgi:hypothetical protein